ncbi:DUF2175 domain-containing protein [Vulcanisaeta souniana]|uniref:DUF2175 domain-containing protein n=1 Tax=Vulcanisaeta souniana JCM 11219 TaxID=1293586 RepID=A0A830EG54_9CREN|nr:DUF2175 domain-containing protein [Vulcanisaeta souniana]BDR92796.1 hypothetical protein Vsou_18890 [Vulcanisaeta souniana JCM 11219]GGI82072.1 hypothetical protein GCM10007112_18510 [Vulcanisaeta souniana JCM 11219]
MSRKVWKCYRCGEDIVEGMKFTFTRLGPIHWECFRAEVRDKFNGNVPEDINVMLELMDYLANGIVKVKELEERASSDDVRRLLIDRRKVIEGETSRLMSELNKMLYGGA